MGQALTAAGVRAPREVYAERICSAWAKTVESVIATGKALAEAKAGLPHGEWMAMVAADLPFGANTAARLMRIARNPVLAAPENHKRLPAAWGTLAELSRWEPAALANALEVGEVTAETERSQARRLQMPPAAVPPTAPAQRPTSRPATPHPAAAIYTPAGNTLADTDFGELHVLRGRLEAYLRLVEALEALPQPAGRIADLVPAETFERLRRGTSK